MDPSMMATAQQLMSDPEVMAMLQDPDVMSRFQEFSANPEGNMHLLNDPDMMRLMSRMQQVMSGGGGGGFGGDTGSYGSYGSDSSSSAAPPAPASSVIYCNSLSELDGVMSRANSSGLPVVVYFFTTWCGPCKRIAPAYDALSTKYSKRCLFVKVDGDKANDAVSIYSVSGFPTFKFFFDSQCDETFSGADGNRLENSTARIISVAEEAKQAKQALLAPKYAHFPLREAEMVLFKTVQYDKLLEKIRSVSPSTLFPPDIDVISQHGFSSVEDFVSVASRFIISLQKVFPHDPVLTDHSSLQALSVMMHLPQLFVTSLHLIRMYCLLAPGASAILDGKLIPNPNPKQSSPNGLIRFLTEQATFVAEALPHSGGSPNANPKCLADCSSEKAIKMGLVLIVRALVNMFDRFALVPMMMAHYEEVAALFSAIMSHPMLSRDANVSGSIFSLMINFVISLHSFSTKHATPSSPKSNLLEDPTFFEAKLFFISTLHTTFFENDDLIQDEVATYKTLLLLGTIIVSGENTQSTGSSHAELIDLVCGLEIPHKCESLMLIHSESQRVMAACGEILKMIKQ